VRSFSSLPESMDLLPLATYGLGAAGDQQQLHVHEKTSEGSPGASGAFTYDTMRDWPEFMVPMETVLTTTVKPVLDALLQTRNDKLATGTTSIDPLTGTRMDAGLRRKPKKIVLVQSEPVVVHDEAEDPASARGDFTFFNAPLSRKNKTFGFLSGTIETYDLALEGDSREVRLRTLIFELPKGQLIAQGVSSYATGPDFVPLDINAQVVIAITGGTDSYMGATGEVRTTRRADGTYRQVITLLQSQSDGTRSINKNLEKNH